jgi:predicted RNase H-like HicB family nuclease
MKIKNSQKYNINLFYSNSYKGYIADIPDLEYCSAFGSTPKEALNEVLKAKIVWIKAARAYEDYCLKKAMDIGKKSELLGRDDALKFLE